MKARFVLRHAAAVVGLSISPWCFAAWPTSTISADKTTIAVGQSVIISVQANDVDGNLQYVNVDQVSPNAGYYGAGHDTGDENPPGGAAYNIGTAQTNYTRNLTLTIGTAGTYVFEGMAADNGSSGWQPSSNRVTVTVSSSTAPTITAHPQSDTKNIGFDVVFGVTATGTTPFSYQWKKAGTDISGATNATLTLLDITSTDQASYSVVVSNSAGPATSDSATLTVTDPDADSDSDGIPNTTETSLGTSSSTTTNDSSNNQQQNIHRPTS